MSSQPHSYAADDPETALKYAIQPIPAIDRVQIVEGVIDPLSPTWGHERAAGKIRDQIALTVAKLGCVSGSGNLKSSGHQQLVHPRRGGRARGSGGCR